MRGALPPRNLGDAERLASGTLGTAIALWAMRRGGIAGGLATLAGAALLVRGAGGYCPVTEALSANPAERQIARGRIGHQHRHRKRRYAPGALFAQDVVALLDRPDATDPGGDDAAHATRIDRRAIVKSGLRECLLCRRNLRFDVIDEPLRKTETMYRGAKPWIVTVTPKATNNGEQTQTTCYNYAGDGRPGDRDPPGRLRG